MARHAQRDGARAAGRAGHAAAAPLLGRRSLDLGDLTRGTVAFRVLSIFLVLAVLVLVMSLVGWHPIRRTTDLAGHILGSGRVSNVTAQAVPADAFPGLPAAWAVDDVRGRGFATRWTLGGNGDPNSACAGPPPPQAAASSLVLTFPKMTNVREIGIEAGLPDGDPQIAARWRPQTLALYWPGGKCQAVQLAKEPGLQRFTVDAGLVNQVTIVGRRLPTGERIVGPARHRRGHVLGADEADRPRRAERV